LPGSKPPTARWTEFALEELLPFEHEPEPPGTVSGVNEGTGHEDDRTPGGQDEEEDGVDEDEEGNTNEDDRFGTDIEDEGSEMAM
jgi:hypothetical protein